jgi:hypothetical protein
MDSAAVGSLAVAAVLYFDLLLADAAKMLQLHKSFFCALHMVL